MRRYYKEGGLTKREKKTLKKHSVHHTPKVLKQIANKVKSGQTFSQAHKDAPKIGKK
jgi:type II secretory pathway component PulF